MSLSIEKKCWTTDENDEATKIIMFDDETTTGSGGSPATINIVVMPKLSFGIL